MVVVRVADEHDVGCEAARERVAEPVRAVVGIDERAAAAGRLHDEAGVRHVLDADLGDGRLTAESEPDRGEETGPRPERAARPRHRSSHANPPRAREV